MTHPRVTAVTYSPRSPSVISRPSPRGCSGCSTALPPTGGSMAAQARSTRRQLWQVLGSVRTGIILLILSGLAVLAGTLILQRPITEPDKLHQAYSPETLRLLDTL